MSLRSVALFYGHVARNIGDLAINLGTLNLVRSVFPDARLRVVLLDVENSPNLPHSLASFGEADNVEFIHFASKGLDATQYALNPGRLMEDCGCGDVDLVLLAAGEHLFSYEDNNNARNMFWRTLPAFAAKAAGIRCAVLPSTFGPFQDEEGKSTLQQFVAAGTQIAVRDLRSAEEVALVAPKAAPQTALDPAYFLAPPGTVSDARQNCVGIVMRSEGVGIRLSPRRRAQFDSTMNEDGYEGTLAARFTTGLVRKVLAESDSRVRIFIQTDTDLPVAEAVAGAFADTADSARLEIVKPVDIADYLDKLAEVDCVVASRFHALIMGMVCGKPGFGVYFGALGHKVPGLMALVGRSDLSRGISADDIDDTIKTVAEWTKAPQEGFSPVWAGLEAQRETTRDWLSGLVSAGEVRALPEQAFGIARVLMEQASRLGTSPADAEQRKLRSQLTRLKRESEQVKGRAAALEEQLSNQQARFEEEAAQAQARLSKLEDTLSQERALFERELEARKAREDDLSKAVAIEREQMKSYGVNLEVARKAARNAAQRLQALENRLDQVENSIAFRLGSALVNAAKSRRNMVRLPREISALYKEHRSRGMPGTERPAPSAPARLPPALRPLPAISLTEEEILALFEVRGVDGVVDRIRDLNPDPASARAALITAAKQLAGEGHLEAEFEMTQKAVEIDQSDASLRALHWAAQRRGDFMTAWDCVRRIETLYGDTPTPVQTAFLEKLRRGPAYQLSLLDLTTPAPTPQIQPVPGRICYVLHNSLPYSSGGYATRAHGLAAGLAAQGFDVVPLTRPGFPLDIRHELSAGEVPRHQTIDGVPYRHVLAPLRTGQSALDYMLAAADALTAEIAEIRPEAVMAASNHLTGLPALIAARRLGLPFIYEVRGFWEITRISREPEFEQSSAFKVQKLLEAELAKRSDHVFTLTGPMRRELIERGVDPEMITLLPNSCEVERFTPRGRDEELAAKLGIPADVPVIGYVGTFVQYEGLENLVEAAAGLRDRGLDFRLLLVGNENASGQDVGPITMEINRIATERGLDQWLIMPGRVPHEEVEAYYSLIDIAPFPRKAQPVTELVSPMKPLEAYAMEKAVVVSSVGALLEMVEHDRTGLVFEKDNIESLTDALARLIADPDLRARLGREGRRWVQAERTWTATAKRAADRVHEATKAAGAPAPLPVAAGAK